VELESRDLGKDRLSEAELDQLIGDRDYKEFLNARNELYREKKMKEKPPSRAEAPQDIMITVKLSFTREGEVFGKPLVTYITPGTVPAHEAAYRKAVAEAFLRCMPLNLSKGLGNAIAGRPFSFSFGNERGRHNAGRAPDADVAYRRPI